MASYALMAIRGLRPYFGLRPHASISLAIESAMFRVVYGFFPDGLTKYMKMAQASSSIELA